MTIYIGWWALPLVLSLVAFFAAWLSDTDSGGYLSGLDSLIFYFFALIFSLVVWLIWALFT